MEEKGIEWVCPNCLKKKDQKNKPSHRSKVSESANSSLNESVNKSSSNLSVKTDVSITDGLLGSGTNSGTLCVVCKKNARTSSIYCSDVCILAHAQESVKDKPSPNPNPNKSQKFPPENIKKVTVYNRESGEVNTSKHFIINDDLIIRHIYAWMLS